MAFRPLYDRVLVKRATAEQKTTSGLYIPESAKEKPQEAEVIAVGPGRRKKDGGFAAMSVSVGDKVLFGKYSGDELKLEGDEHIVLREKDILAIVG